MPRLSAFTDLALIRRTLSHFRALSLAQALGVAIAMAVLTGALLVGHSVRASLQQMTLRRLGPFTHALVSTQLLDESLPDRVKSQPAFPRGADCIPLLSVRGRAAGAGRNVAGVQMIAVGGPLDPTASAPGSAVVNGTLSDALSASDAKLLLTLSVPALAEGSRESVLANRARSDVLASLQARVSATARQPGFVSLFDLSPSQRPPRNVWLPLPALQEAVGQPGRVNGALVTNVPAGADLDAVLKQSMTLSDYGLSLVPSHDGAHVQLMSRSTYLPHTVSTAGDAVAREMRISAQRVVVDFATAVTNTRSSKTTHYTTLAGITQLDGAGIPSSSLGGDEVALNQWAADQLQARVGDPIRIRHYRRADAGNIVESDTSTTVTKLTVARILPMEGLGIDRALVPPFKGLTDVERVSDWRPPEGIKIDQSLADDDYWDRYRAAPKVFLNFATAQLLHGDSVQLQSGLRIPAGSAEEFSRRLLERLTPADVGLSFIPVREQQLAAARGSTDFSGLFIGFSFFLMISALLVLGMLVRLSVEHRARQLGLLAALGYGPGRLRWLLLRESLAVAAVGVLVGLGLAIGYTALMIHGLRTWWVGATGTTHLELHVSPAVLVTGAVITLALVALTTLWSVRRALKSQPASLLAGGLESRVPGAGRIRRLVYHTIMAATFLPAAAFIGLGAAQKMDPKVAFLLAGTLLLIAGLTALRRLLEPRRRALTAGIAALSFRNAAWRPTRSLLTAALIALASFTLVTVGSMKQTAPPDPYTRPSGTGGFALILTADIPLLGDLNTAIGRRILGMRDSENPLLSRARFTSLRSWQGQDASCLNMTKPTQPTLLELPEHIRDRFLLDEPHEAGRLAPGLRSPDMLDGRTSTVPILADAETAQYILHMQIDDVLPIQDQTGRQRLLHLRGTLHGSIFQSELLVHPHDFRQMFPYQSGFSTVLIDCPPEDAAALAHLLEDELGEFSVTVESTAARLQRYREVANTYLSTFQALGALGLLLGTVGVGIALVRAVFERRAELALLGALGFSRRRLAWLVFLENAWLLGLGLAIGTGAALLAVLPSARALNAGNLAFTFGGILAFGLLVVLAATRIATRTITPALLRAL